MCFHFKCNNNNKLLLKLKVVVIISKIVTIINL